MPLPQVDILQLAAMIAGNPALRSAYMGQQGMAMPDVPQAAPPVAVPVPGQNAQAVMPGGIFDQPIPTEQPGPDSSSTIGQVDPSLVSTLQSRVPSGQPTQGGANFVGDIMGALRGAPGATTATHSPEQGGGFMGGLKGFAQDAAFGAAGANPAATPLSTLATAFAGSMASGQSRHDRKRAENAAAEERTYQRGRDTIEDSREDRRLTLDERRALIQEAGMDVTPTIREWRQNNADRATRDEEPLGLEEFIKFKSASARTGQLTAVDKKAILEADEMVMAGENAVSALDRALELNELAYSGPGAKTRGYGASVADSILPGDQSAMAETGAATEEFQNVVMQQVLENLKATFGGMPTEGERKVLIDVQGSVNKAPKVRAAILQRARDLAASRIEFNRSRAEEIRGDTFYRPEVNGPPSIDAPAEAPTPAEPPEPGTVEDGYRFRGGDPADPESWEPAQ